MSQAIPLEKHWNKPQDLGIARASGITTDDGFGITMIRFVGDVFRSVFFKIMK